MKWIDLPPLWLLGFLYVTWELRGPDPVVAGQHYVGVAFVAIGVVLMLGAVWEMRRRRTTVIPHMMPVALVSSGVFGVTRNPIYLGDACVLLGMILYWQAHPIALLLVPLFGWIITRRFIIPEEARLRVAFGADFERYAAKINRWV